MRGDPSGVAEIPHPRKVSASLPFVESAEWFACGPPPATTQGWKLYVPLTIANANELIERLAPFVWRAGLHFKYIRTIKLLRKLNAGTFGYPQIGKCFVIYLPVPDGSFLKEIKNILAPYRDQCPAVPCALPFGDYLPLYYRYGAYQSDRLQVGGGELADDREDPAAAVPDGVEDALAPYAVPAPESAEIRSFLLRYPVYQALIQQGKCGVFLALNLESESFQEVVLKVGYHRGQVQPDGSDGCSFVRREIAFYRELRRRGLEDVAPRLIDAFDAPRNVILVLEYIAGSSLLTRKLQDRLNVEHLDRCWALMNRLHAGGLYLGDAKLANFIATDDGDLRVLDFEAAGVLGEDPPAIQTFFLDPEPDDPRLGDRAHFLASVLYSYEEGRYSWGDRHVALEAWLDAKPDSDLAAWALDKLRLVLGNLRSPHHPIRMP
jgi:hypothetical protein